MMPDSKGSYGDYCLRALGSDVIEINVSDDQVSDRINDALQYFQMFHYDSVEKQYIAYIVTQEDVDAGHFTIPEPVLSVVSVLNLPAYGEHFGTPLWHMKADIYAALGGTGTSKCSSGNLSNYVMKMQKLAEFSSILDPAPRTRYYQHSNHLFIDDDITEMVDGDTIVIEAYVIIDSETHKDIWNDIWLKKYGVAVIGRQWGANLQKFQQVELPGGIQLNGDEIYNQYDEQVTTLEEEMNDKWSYPPEFYIA